MTGEKDPVLCEHQDVGYSRKLSRTLLAVAIVLLIVLSAAAGIALEVSDALSIDRFVTTIRSWGAWGILASIGLMVLHSFVPFPAELLACANGMVYGTLWGTVITWTGAMLGASIAFGVVYNSMRIALSERNRELASLRVLGFNSSEVAYILLGEQAILTFLSIPLGMLFGYGLCAYLAFKFQTDLYRIPLVLGLNVYAFAALVVIVSSLISALMIWRNLSHLDMVAVLKTKE